LETYGRGVNKVTPFERELNEDSVRWVWSFCHGRWCCSVKSIVRSITGRTYSAEVYTRDIDKGSHATIKRYLAKQLDKEEIEIADFLRVIGYMTCNFGPAAAFLS